jgi:5-formaminoimidazole-4-carboxamide-1-beta-D-ribofuranosyl 5'-monophosphate synthetase
VEVQSSNKMHNLHPKIIEVGHPPPRQRRGQVISIFECSEKFVKQHENA